MPRLSTAPGDVGLFTSVTVGADGLGLITYWDALGADLKAAHCSDQACSTAAVTTIESAGAVGYVSSVTIGTDGLPLMSYWEYTNDDLKAAHCANALCVPYFRRR